MYWVVKKNEYVQLSYVINNRDKAVLKLFGEHLRTLRVNAGLSQEQLALKADVSKNQIGNIERGEVNITLVSAVSISKALEISLSKFFDLEL